MVIDIVFFAKYSYKLSDHSVSFAQICWQIFVQKRTWWTMFNSPKKYTF